MTANARRLFRLLLLLYPAEFRHRYGDDMLRLQIDRQRNEGRRTSSILLDEFSDAVRAAPRQRWESPMNRTVIVIVTATLAIAAAIVANILLVPLAIAALLAWFLLGRGAQPIASSSASPQWKRWMLAGGLAVVAAIAIPAIDGGELNEVWWTVMAISLLGGIAMIVTALVLVTSNRSDRQLRAPHS